MKLKVKLDNEEKQTSLVAAFNTNPNQQDSPKLQTNLMPTPAGVYPTTGDCSFSLTSINDEHRNPGPYFLGVEEAGDFSITKESSETTLVLWNIRPNHWKIGRRHSFQ